MKLQVMTLLVLLLLVTSARADQFGTNRHWTGQSDWSWSQMRTVPRYEYDEPIYRHRYDDRRRFEPRQGAWSYVPREQPRFERIIHCRIDTRTGVGVCH